MASGKEKTKMVQDRMAYVSGVTIEDLEASGLCESTFIELFGRKGIRHITPRRRLTLARELRRRYHLSYRQLSTLTRLPETEHRTYI